jgi:hypothetical protein
MAKKTIKERIASIDCPHCGKPINVREKVTVSSNAMAEFGKEMEAAGDALAKAFGHVGEAVKKMFK